ncbi:porin [Undibacterium sp.]|uniref:porin n=1 Tax=Undibacterium sp. TaxID=1914977 RepID=UPI0025EB8D18|nr:porin [Undibacterium sp.]
MKKSLLALALMGAFSGAALAQSSVTVYGLVDMGVVRDDNGAATNSTKYSLDSGNQSGSRLGFKGTEDLGNGLKANFVLEMGLKADTGASDGTTFGRQAFVGLSGDFGAVNFGRQKSLTYVASESIDPFAVGLAGNMNRLFSTVTRVDNAAIYTTPNMSGFSAAALFGFGEKAGDNSKSSVRSLAGTYNAGPVFASVVYEKAYDATLSFNPLLTSAMGVRTEKTLVGGSYDFSVVKAHAAFEQLKGVSPATITTAEKEEKANIYMVGVTVPVGAGAFLADYTKFTNKTAGVTDANAQQYALGYTYNLSKRTNLYTSYSYTKNDSNSSVNVYSVDAKGASVANFGKSDKLFNVGIRHTF